MTNQLTVFSNEQFGDLRTITINGEPYFCLADVCRMLDIDNSRQVKTRLRIGGVINNDTPTESGVQTMTYINEGNLYRVIFQSRKPEAEKFADWVFDDVLPTIRKTGSYGIAAPSSRTTLSETVRGYFTAAKCLRESHPGLKARTASAAALQAITDTTSLDFTRFMPLLPSEDKPGTMTPEDKPGTMTPEDKPGTLTPTELGKYFNLSARKVNKCLKELNLQTYSYDKYGWSLTGTGRQYGEEVPYSAYSGHAGYQIRWNDSVKDLIAAYLGA